MASGRINGTTANERIVAMLDWSETQTDIANNRSRVSLSLKYKRTNTGYGTYGSWRGSITVNGTTYNATRNFTATDAITENENEAMSVDVWITHNADGTMTLTLSATGAISGTSLSSTTLSGTAVLDTIGQATTPVLSPTTQTMGQVIAISLAGAASSAFTHTLTYEFGTATGTIVTRTPKNTSINWTVPASLATEIPYASSGTGRIYCETFNGNTSIGTKSVQFTANVPSGNIPVVLSVQVTDTKSAQYTAMGGFVQGKSSAQFAITAQGSTGSTISQIRTTVDGNTYAGANFTTGVIKSSGTVQYTVTVTDSKGRTGTYTGNITVFPYSAPIVSSVTATRCDAGGNDDDEGNRIKISASAEFASVGRSNTLYYYVSYRRSGQTTWYYAIGETSVPNTSSPATLTLTDVVLPQTYDPDTTYDIRVAVWDYWTADREVYQTATVTTIAYIMDISPDGDIAFGKVSEYPGMEIAMPGTAPQMTAGRATADDSGNSFITQAVTSGVVTGTYGASITYQRFLRYGKIAVLSVHLETTEQMAAGVVFVGSVISQARPATGFLEVPGGGYVYESGAAINARISSTGLVEVRSTVQLPANKDFYISFTYIVA